MFYRLSRTVDKVHVKVALVCFWVPATIMLAAPLPVLVALFGVSRGLEGSMTRAFFANALVLGALWGLAAVWVRIFLSSHTLRKSTIFWPTVLGLAVGITEMSTILIMAAMSERNLSEWGFWAFVAVEFLGLLLLGATAGARAAPPKALSPNERSLDAA